MYESGFVSSLPALRFTCCASDGEQMTPNVMIFHVVPLEPLGVSVFLPDEYPVEHLLGVTYDGDLPTTSKTERYTLHRKKSR